MGEKREAETNKRQIPMQNLRIDYCRENRIEVTSIDLYIGFLRMPAIQRYIDHHRYATKRVDEYMAGR